MNRSHHDQDGTLSRSYWPSIFIGLAAASTIYYFSRKHYSSKIGEVANAFFVAKRMHLHEADKYTASSHISTVIRLPSKKKVQEQEEEKYISQCMRFSKYWGKGYLHDKLNKITRSPNNDPVFQIVKGPYYDNAFFWAGTIKNLYYTEAREGILNGNYCQIKYEELAVHPDKDPFCVNRTILIVGSLYDRQIKDRFRRDLLKDKCQAAAGKAITPLSEYDSFSKIPLYWYQGGNVQRIGQLGDLSDFEINKKISIANFLAFRKRKTLEDTLKAEELLEGQLQPDWYSPNGDCIVYGIFREAVDKHHVKR